MQQNKPLFSFTLRVHRQLVRLNVFPEDFFEDVMERFAALIGLKKNFNEKIKEKLEDQLRKVVLKEDCSEKVRDKIEGFLEESKLVIVAVTETEHFEETEKEKGLKGAQENGRQGKKVQGEQAKQSYPSSQTVSPVLTKYLSKEILVQQSQEQKSIDEIVDKLTNHQKNNQYECSFRPSQHTQHNYITSDFDLRKGADSFVDIEAISRNRIARSQQREMRAEIDRPAQHKRKYSGYSILNKYEQPKFSSNESYENYKQSKKENALSKQPSRDCIKSLTPSSSQYLQPSKSINAIKYQPSSGTKANFDYDRCFQAKGISGGFKQNKKFRYLG